MANFLKSSMCVHRYQQYLSPSQKLGYLDHPVLRKVWNEHFLTFFFFLDFSIQNAKKCAHRDQLWRVITRQSLFISVKSCWSSMIQSSKHIKTKEISDFDPGPPCPLKKLLVLQQSEDNFEVHNTARWLSSVTDLKFWGPLYFQATWQCYGPHWRYFEPHWRYSGPHWRYSRTH